MSENPYPQIGKAELDLAKIFEQAGQVRATQPENTPQPASMPGQAGPEGKGSTELRPERFTNPLGNISLHFKVDSETNQITVMILDKATRRVLRTIPPDEVTKLQAGDLLSLFT
jgi:hypothetical protein